MGDYAPRFFSYSAALAEIIVGSESMPKKILEAKLEALHNSWALLNYYEKENFDTRLLDAIMEKKAAMILAATTVKDLREIGRPPKPHYSGNQWYISANAVPEEEMIWWSMTSLHGPLCAEAVARYMQLFKDFYGFSVDDV